MVDESPQFDRRKIRMGLALIGVVLIVALVMVVVIESAAGKSVMFAIALVAFVRLFLLTRSIRRGDG
jgi:hypothetical protein